MKDMKFMAASTKRKRREAGDPERCSISCSIPMPVFNQSFVFNMAQSEETDRYMVFECRWRFFWQNKNFVGRSGDQKKFELSSCLETKLTCQSRASTPS